MMVPAIFTSLNEGLSRTTSAPSTSVKKRMASVRSRTGMLRWFKPANMAAMLLRAAQVLDSVIGIRPVDHFAEVDRLLLEAVGQERRLELLQPGNIHFAVRRRAVELALCGHLLVLLRILDVGVLGQQL